VSDEKEFVPFGPEWKKEMMKFPKHYLLDQLADTAMKLVKLESKIELEKLLKRNKK